MPEYLSPGVYVEEIEIGARPIEGVSTSTVGFLGETERGPTQPAFISSLADFDRKFGSFFGGTKFLPYAIKGFFDNGGKRYYVARIVKKADDQGLGAAVSASKKLGDALTVEAVGEGAWGDRIAIKVSPGSDDDGFRLSLHYWRGAKPENPSNIDDEDKRRNIPQPVLSEDFDNLSVEEASPDYFEKRVNGISNVITLFKQGTDTGAVPDSPAAFEYLGDGSDGADEALDVADFTRTDTDTPGKRKGLTALKEIDVQIVYAPNAQAIENLDREIIEHCELSRYRFAIIDAKQGAADVSSDDLKPRSQRPTEYAAFYYPWIKIFDGEAGVRRLVPPGGYVAGIYARSDTERGVHKAPANEVVRGAVDLEFPITAEQDILNPRGVNVIRAFPGRGIRVWGARTLASNSLWKYINVRRLFIFLEDSIFRNTQWVVFEPNNEQLWDRVKQTITAFLTTQWRTGAFIGTTPDEAFFVKVDRTTMTQDDIDNGRLIVVIGVAPTKPAEFVIFRIAQVPPGSAEA